MNHWVGHSLMKHIDVDKFFSRRVVISSVGSSLNDDNAMGTSVVSEG